MPVLKKISNVWLVCRWFLLELPQWNSSEFYCSWYRENCANIRNCLCNSPAHESSTVHTWISRTYLDKKATILRHYLLLSLVFSNQNSSLSVTNIVDTDGMMTDQRGYYNLNESHRCSIRDVAGTLLWFDCLLGRHVLLKDTARARLEPANSHLCDALTNVWAPFHPTLVLILTTYLELFRMLLTV